MSGRAYCITASGIISPEEIMTLNNALRTASAAVKCPFRGLVELGRRGVVTGTSVIGEGCVRLDLRLLIVDHLGCVRARAA
jgi:hypothetical protein